MAEILMTSGFQTRRLDCDRLFQEYSQVYKDTSYDLLLQHHMVQLKVTIQRVTKKSTSQLLQHV